MNSADRQEIIFELQNDLRTLYKSGIIAAQITPTGVFDDQTASAVREFQRTAGLPETGIVDYPTWVILNDTARDIRGESNGSAPIYPFDQIREGASVGYGEVSDLVYIIQIMLKRLLGFDFDRLGITGRFDRATAEAVRQFQRAGGLEVTGSVNKSTWDSLADSYNINVVRSH